MKAAPHMDRRTALGTLGSLGWRATAATAWWATAPSAAQAQANPGPWVLGQSAAFSGPAAELGQQYHLGAKLHFDRLNASGGVEGRKVDLRKLDDGYEPERCVANTRQFINDGVFALFGYVGTPTSQAALALATEAKVPLFAPLTGAQSLREPFNRQVVHIRASYLDETAAIVKQTTALGIQRLAVFHQNDGYGQAGLDGVRRALATHQLEPVAVGTVERNSAEVGAALATILAAKPEAIVQVGTYKACAVFIRLARKAGFAGTLYNVSFVGTQALLDELGAMAAGVAVTQVMPFPYAPVSPLASEYLAALKSDDARGLSPNYTSMEGFVAARVFTEALRRAGKAPTRDSLLGAIQGMTAFNAGGFNLSYGSQKNAGSSFVELTLLTKDGQVRR
ncbi:MAG: ABC transporter permease [Polaromonas sp.]|nr:ABC transporter permease [Polaromonas sp.]